MSERSFNHPTLGQLHSDDGYLWEGEAFLPCFAKHGWNETLQIQIYGDEQGPPHAHAIALLEPLITSAPRLPDLIVDGLWNELSGGEAENNHWWARHGGLEAANEVLDEPLAARDDLWRVLHPNSLFVREDTHGDGHLTAGVGFGCDFEEEHGLDVLTDSIHILGTGYALDAQKYARFARR